MKKLKYLLAVLITLIPSVVHAGDLEYIACGNAEGIPAPVPQLISICYTLLIIATPIILIAFSIITLLKAITGGNADAIKKAKDKVIKKFVAAALVFFVAGLTQFVISRAATTDGDKNSMVDCINCMLYNDGCAPSTAGDDAYQATTRPPEAEVQQSNPSGNNNTNNNNNNSNNNTTPNVATKTILVGDSRTAGICQYTTEALNVGKCREYLTVSQVGKGYSWFKTTGISNVNSLLTQSSGTTFNIIILLGVNDVSNTTSAADSAVNGYISTLTTQAKGEWKNHNIIFTSVTPLGAETTGGKYPVTQTNINYFNSQMKSKINATGLSNFKYCDINSGLNLSGKISSDHIHYTSEGYTTVYNQVVNKCL